MVTGQPVVPLASGAPVVEGVFLERPNRFVMRVRLESGEEVLAHCADRGRLLWLEPGLPMLVGIKPGEGRKTTHQAAAVWAEGAWASVDTHLPNRLVREALRQGALEPFRGYPVIRQEARHGSSRFDFLLEEETSHCFVEVKSVGMIREGIGLFPDAPTERGRRHVEELAALRTAGVRTAIIFIAQHAAATAVSPARDIDPAFAEALRRAADTGVEIYAYRCPIQPGGITLEAPIPCVV